MTLNTSLRNWHTWLGVTIALPVIVVSITAILMAHGQELGIRNIPHNLGWLPGYQESEDSKMKATKLDIRSTLTTQDGRYLIGTRYGLYQLQQNQLKPVEGLAAADIRSIKQTPKGTILLASRNGVWQNQGSLWKKIYKGDAWEIELRPSETIRISTRAKGFMESSDGGVHWKAVSAINDLPAVLSPEAKAEEMTVGKLIFDLHTGRAFFGKDLNWLWIDATGFMLMLLVLSGLFLWRAVKKRERMLKGRGIASAQFDSESCGGIVTKTEQKQYPVTILPGTRFQFQGQGTLLSAMHEEGLNLVNSDCRVGSCGSCKMRLVEGEVDWLIQPEYQTQADEILLCCCIPKKELTLKH